MDEATRNDRPPRTSAEPAIGTMVGRYRLIARLGEGGMGIVFRAADPSLGREVAIKILHDATTSERTERLLREAQAMAQLSHENLVTVHDVGHDGQRVFLAMELVDGVSLRDWLGDPARDWRARLAAVLTAARGLSAAHDAGIVHRDFKPENVLVDRAGRIKVADFGLARADHSAGAPALAGPVDLTRTGSVLGTPSYMAPEQHAGDVADARADQFALAVVMWEAIWGRRPFRSDDYGVLAFAIRSGDIEPPPRQRDVPPAIERTLRRALAVERADRYPSVDALVTAVAAAAVPPSRKRVAILAAVLATAIAGVGIRAVLAPSADEAGIPSKPVKIVAARLPQRPLPPMGFTLMRPTHHVRLHVRSVTSLAFTPDGRRIVTASPDNTVKLWDVASWKLVRQFAGEAQRIGAARISPDGRTVIASADNQLRIWDLETGALQRTIASDPKHTFGIAISPDGTAVASCGLDGVVTTWSIATGARIATFPHGDLRVYTAAFTPDGSTLVTAGDGPAVKVWDVATQRLVRTLEGHQGSVPVVVISPDGQTIVTVGTEPSVKVWTIGGGLVRTLSGFHAERITAAAFMQDGTLITGDSMGLVGLWDLATGRMRGSRDLMSREHRAIANDPAYWTRLHYTWVADGSNAPQSVADASLSIAVSPVNDTLVIGQREASVVVWDLPQVSPAPPPQANVVPFVVPRKAAADERAYVQAMQLLDSWCDCPDGPAKLDEAATLLARAAEPSTASARIHAGLARVDFKRYQDGGKRDLALLASARTQNKRALTIAPTFADALVLAGWIAQITGDAGAAVVEVDRALAVAPSSPRVLLLATQLALDAGDLERAERSMGTLFESPLDPALAAAAYRQLIEVYIRTKNIAGMEIVHRRIVELDPESTRSRARQAEFLTQIGDHRRAITAAKEALARVETKDLREKLVTAWCALGAELLWDQEQSEEAKEAFTAAVEASQGAATCAHYGLGAYWRTMALTLSDPAFIANADRAYARALELSPEDKRVTTAIAQQRTVRMALGQPPPADRR